MTELCDPGGDQWIAFLVFGSANARAVNEEYRCHSCFPSDGLHLYWHPAPHYEPGQDFLVNPIARH
jgi:hypothetical protein